MKCNALFVYRTSTDEAIIFECSLSEGHRGLHMAWNHPTDDNHFCLSFKKDWSEELVKCRSRSGRATSSPEPGVEGAEATLDPPTKIKSSRFVLNNTDRINKAIAEIEGGGQQ